MIIDSDAHVIETDKTWEYYTEADKHLKPMRLQDKDTGAEFLRFEGDSRLHPIQRTRDVSGPNLGDRMETPDDSRLLTNVQSRIRHMDELGTDIQVLYPTMLISPYTMRVDIEVAMCRSYNRWLADIWGEGQGRLRWAVAAPFRSVEASIEEMRWAKDHGACAVFSRGIECNNKLLSDPYFDPIYAEAQEHVTCQTNDDLPYVLNAVGDDFLVMGTDYGHADTSTELYALQTFKKSSDLPSETVRKILDDNARRSTGSSPPSVTNEEPHR